jgi:hypothetical protein
MRSRGCYALFQGSRSIQKGRSARSKARPQCEHCKRLATPRGALLDRTLRAAPRTGRLRCCGSLP